MSAVEGFHNGMLDNRFLLLEEIARRNTASIFVGKDLSDNHLIAAKIYDRQIPEEDIAHEAEVQYALRHPHILPLEAYRVYGDSPYIITEFASGGSLNRYVGKLQMENAVPFVLDASDGLEYAHQTVLHRDIKPDNLLVTDTGLKIGDWETGLYLELQDSPPRDKKFGTFGYAAPEQIIHGEVSKATDLYSLGRVAYEVFTGKKPYSKRELLSCAQNKYFYLAPTFEQSVGKRNMTVFHELLEEPVQKALNHAASDRQGSVGEFAEEVRVGYTEAKIIYLKRRTVIDLKAVKETGRHRTEDQRRRRFWIR